MSSGRLPSSRPVWAGSGGIFDVAAKEQRLAQPDTEMAQPSFWEDNRRAQEVIRERTDLSRLATRVKEPGGNAEDPSGMRELAGEATGGSGSLRSRPRAAGRRASPRWPSSPRWTTSR